ncbi:TPA: hypothetical protein JBB06_05230 [Legionella pneumophila subsp. pneumophila]|uniref:Uncharacterized protein n=1 Tax=Legionella pneumophila (strain Lens) TaxID=297245 RepID=Q5WTN1_LEGPL|nr:STY4851/ECs_5259 family protein [Legionella pneumophila]AOW50956.1 hypothetical protein BE841_00055 [Legionella pneumophila subsp. pneumophila]AOW55441.1 hypothetical protein BE842_08700 [Legionella pneumophila subsp. pneumophila]AOW64464.1 hypothetical protein BE845_10515 [Legionella pneumophila subsp. pneumophila]RYW83369.1 hypothetical protein D7216_08540 [Legionella pneumophila]CAH16733.1 hypothetical protein lpl2493 [Legionella pneumophila str. Lens]
MDHSHSEFWEWKKGLFAQLNIPNADGRPLYAYRLTEHQFNELEKLLRKNLTKNTKYGILGMLVDSSAQFCSLFVLYAAEWWRRRFDGSRWSWEPILLDLGVDKDSWSASQRENCIIEGLKRWRLRLSNTDGLRYLGTIAVQGGLPMQLLADAKGSIGRILRNVLKLATHGTELNIILNWVESLHEELPKSYQKKDVYLLLAEVIAILLALKKEAQLTNSLEAVDKLNKIIPNWRERFPLPIDDNEIKGLLEQLIRDVASERNDRCQPLFSVERYLDCQNEEIWQLRSTVFLPDKISTNDIYKQFDINEEIILPRILEIVIEVSNWHRSVTARRIAGQNLYFLNQSPFELKGDFAADEHMMSLRTMDGARWIIALRNGSELNSGLPWVFEKMKETFPRLIRQGGGGVKSVEAFIAVPCGWILNALSGSRCIQISYIEEPEREVYLVNGEVRVLDGLGRFWTIKTGRADSNDESFYWSGDRMWGEFIRPPLAFLGKPKLYKFSGETSYPIQDTSVTWTQGRILGFIEAYYAEHHEEKVRSKMVILPSEAKIDIKPESLDHGVIYLRHWRVANANLSKDSKIELCVKNEGDSLVLSCNSITNRPPEWFEVNLSWESNTATAKVRLPFPAKGARCFDPSGAVLPSESWVSIKHLAGYRIIIISPPHAFVELCLRLRHTSDPHKDHEFRRPLRSFGSNSVQKEIRLQDYSEDIENLLAADELLDAWVEASILIERQTSLVLKISRYDCPLERDDSLIKLGITSAKKFNINDIASLPLLALKLEQPADEAIILPQRYSEGVPVGSWEFSPSEKEPGSWLIFPMEGSAILFRPTLWVVAGETHTSRSLAKALSVENRLDRAKVLDQVIMEMSFNYLDPNWSYFEHLAEHLGHLPLASLDLWKRFIRSPQAMAALALRMNKLPDHFLHRFSLELPFIWEIITFECWKNATEYLKMQCIEWFGEIFAPKQLYNHITERVAEFTMVNEQPELRNLLGVVKSTALGEQCSEILMMKRTGSDSFFEHQLFIGEDCALQKLLREHSGTQWPNDSELFYLVKNYRKHHDFHQLFPTPLDDHKDGVIGLPILLAAQVATSSIHEWFRQSENIHKLRTYKRFDPEWFELAFDLTIARTVSCGLMKI